MKNKDSKPELHPTGGKPSETKPDSTRSGRSLYLIRDTETGDLFTCAWQRVEQSHVRVTTELVLRIMRNQVGQARFEMVEFEERSNTDQTADREAGR